MSDEDFHTVYPDDDDVAALGIAHGSEGTWSAWVGPVPYIVTPLDHEMVALRVARAGEPARVALVSPRAVRCPVEGPFADDALVQFCASEQTTDALGLAVRAAWAASAPGLVARDDADVSGYVEVPGGARILVWRMDPWLFGRCHETREAFARRIDTPRTTAPGGSA